MLEEFPYWYNYFHKWESGSRDDIEKVVESSLLFSGGKGREKKGKSKKESGHCSSS